MVNPLITLLLVAGAAPCENGCNSGAFWSPYACPHRQVDACPGAEVLAQTPAHHKYPARTAWMWRYTHKYGIHYARMHDFRLQFDYPWYKRGDSLPPAARPGHVLPPEVFDNPPLEVLEAAPTSAPALPTFDEQAQRAAQFRNAVIVSEQTPRNDEKIAAQGASTPRSAARGAGRAFNSRGVNTR